MFISTVAGGKKKKRVHYEDKRLWQISSTSSSKTKICWPESGNTVKSFSSCVDRVCPLYWKTNHFLNRLLLCRPQWRLSCFVFFLQQVWQPIEYAVKFWWIISYARCSLEFFRKRSKEQRYWIVRVYSNKYCSRRVLSKAWAHCQNHCCSAINIWWSILMHERIHLALLWRGCVYSRSEG